MRWVLSSWAQRVSRLYTTLKFNLYLDGSSAPG
jgi:hypothetical protein